MHVRRAIVLLIAAAIVGCAATPAGHAPPGGVTLAARPYAVGIGDRLRFESSAVPELHEQEASVGDDGLAALPLLGPTFVAGRTPAQLGSELEEKLRRFYVAPTVRVSVFLHQSQRWYTESGNVRVARPYTGRDKPADALEVVTVRGLAPVRVLRPDESGRLRPVELGNEPLDVGDVVRIGDAPDGKLAQAEDKR